MEKLCLKEASGKISAVFSLFDENVRNKIQFKINRKIIF